MLKFYLSTVIVWMIIIYCVINIFKTAYIKNGWVDIESNSHNNSLKNLVIISAVPLLRLGILCFIIYMASATKEDFEELVDKLKQS